MNYAQASVNSGACWLGSGSGGRGTMELLECGAIMLPKHETKDYYQNIIPSRDYLKKGTKGTFQNSVNFWSRYLDGEFFIEDGEII